MKAIRRPVALLLAVFLLLGLFSGCQSAPAEIPETTESIRGDLSADLNLPQGDGGKNLHSLTVRGQGSGNSVKDYTILVYMVGSNLESQGGYASSDILEMLEQNVSDPGLLRLTRHIFETYREAILTSSAAMGKHHAHIGGLLEHTRNVLWNAVTLAHRYAEIYPEMDPPLNISVAACGAALHDIGKLRELRQTAAGFEYTPEGNLIGHIVIGRDYVRDAAAELKQKDPEFQLDHELQLRLEHTILSHQRLPEWGAPKTNMTPESLLIHYADDIDAKYGIMKSILASIPEDAEFSDSKNSMRVPIFRGIKESQ